MKMYREMMRQLPGIVTSSNTSQNISQQDRDQCSKMVSERMTKELRKYEDLIKGAFDVNFNAANDSAKVGINKIVDEAKSKIEGKIESLINNRLSKLEDELDEKFNQQCAREKAVITNELALAAIEAKTKSMRDFEMSIKNEVQEATKKLKRHVTKAIDEEKLGTLV